MLYAYNTVTLGASGIFYGYLGAMIAFRNTCRRLFLIYMLQQYIYVILINVAFTFLQSSGIKGGTFWRSGRWLF